MAKQDAWSTILTLGFTTAVAIEVGFYYSIFEQVERWLCLPLCVVPCGVKPSKW